MMEVVGMALEGMRMLLEGLGRCKEGSETFGGGGMGMR